MSHDLKKYKNQTTKRLIIGGIILLYFVGIGLVYLIYGPAAATSGFICLSLGAIPIVLIIFFLWIIDWIRTRYQDQ